MNTLSILLIDDDCEDREVLAKILVELNPNINCLHALNGSDALQLLDKISPLPQYIFLDIMMPVMSGKECLRKIKENKRLKNIPVVIYATTKYIADIEDAKILGASYYMTKPVNREEIRSSLKMILSHDLHKDNTSTMIFLNTVIAYQNNKDSFFQNLN
jgi:CheY-like chemotaxis protein